MTIIIAILAFIAGFAACVNPARKLARKYYHRGYDDALRNIPRQEPRR